jgi:hypothetical protein
LQSPKISLKRLCYYETLDHIPQCNGACGKGRQYSEHTIYTDVGASIAEMESGTDSTSMVTDIDTLITEINLTAQYSF